MGKIKCADNHIIINWKKFRPWAAFNGYGVAIAILSGSFYVFSLYIEDVFFLDVSKGVIGLVLLAVFLLFVKNIVIWNKHPYYTWNFKWINNVELKSYFILCILVFCHLYIAYAIVEVFVSYKIGIIFIVYFLFPWILLSSRIVRFSQENKS